MVKIKRFKVEISMHKVLRYCNETVSAVNKETLKQTIEIEISNMTKLLDFASVFDTFERSELEQINSILSPEAFSVSLIIVTVGDKIESKILEAQNEGNSLLAQIRSGIAIEACNQAEKFIYRLLHEKIEAKEAELSAIQKMPDKYIGFVTDILQGKKIGVYTKDNKSLQPTYTSVCFVEWLPKKKFQKNK